MKIGIAGAGIMGCLLAYVFAKQGFDVSLYDEALANDLNPANCSMAAAGSLAPVAELEKSDLLIYKLGIHAITQQWPEILNDIGNDVYFNQAGSILLSHAQNQAELQRFLSIVRAKEGGMMGTHFYSNETDLYKKLTRNEIMIMEPQLSKFEEAYYFPSESCIDSQEVMRRLKKWLSCSKVEWKTGFVNDVTPGSIHIAGLLAHQVIRYDLAIDCRGMGAKSVFTELHAIRGELIWLYAPDIHIHHPIRFIHPRYQQLYLLPRPDQIYILGASEIHAEDYSELSVLSCLELLTTAYYLNPAFAEARIVKTVTQCRPMLSDSLPKIYYEKNYLAINGLYRHGFLVAPTLMDEIYQWVTKGESALHYPELWEKKA